MMGDTISPGYEKVVEEYWHTYLSQAWDEVGMQHLDAEVERLTMFYKANNCQVFTTKIQEEMDRHPGILEKCQKHAEQDPANMLRSYGTCGHTHSTAQPSASQSGSSSSVAAYDTQCQWKGKYWGRYYSRDDAYRYKYQHAYRQWYQEDHQGCGTTEENEAQSTQAGSPATSEISPIVDEQIDKWRPDARSAGGVEFALAVEIREKMDCLKINDLSPMHQPSKLWIRMDGIHKSVRQRHEEKHQDMTLDVCVRTALTAKIVRVLLRNPTDMQAALMANQGTVIPNRVVELYEQHLNSAV